ncbi:VanZ family protein [Microbacterium sp. NPDC055683]
MSDQLFPAIIAILLGVVVGVVLFVPFVAVQYRREGRLTLRQSLLWAGFLVYGLALWTYTLLPLPDTDAIRCVGAQLRPFQFVDDVLDYPVGSAGALVRNPAVMQVAMNVLLFAPLGFFLRLVWRRGVVVSTIAGFAVSLAIETTQLTGVWGIYPCAYRFFDVDDLIANTSGALLGAILSLALRPWLARRDRMAVAPTARPVTFWRRLVGMLCDVLAVWLIGGSAGVAVNAWRLYVLQVDPATFDGGPAGAAAVWVPFAVLAVVVLTTGRTLGDLAVLIRWEGGARPTPLARALRYLAGIGGWQLLTAVAAPLDGAFALASIIALIAMRDRSGLPGLIARMRPVDARAEVTASDAGRAAPRPR